MSNQVNANLNPKQDPIFLVTPAQYQELEKMWSNRDANHSYEDISWYNQVGKEFHIILKKLSKPILYDSAIPRPGT